jgi:uncharacterized protein with FMN-binding domain
VAVAGLSLFLASELVLAQTLSHGQAELQARQVWKTADGLRAQRKFDVAVKAYEKSLEILTRSGGDKTTLGMAAMQMIEFCKAMPLDVKTLKDGTYQGKAWGYAAEMTVEVTLQGGRIKQFKVLEQKESAPRKALEVVPRFIVSRQTPNVEAVTGATTTSYGLMTATQRALLQAREAKETKE